MINDAKSFFFTSVKKKLEFDTKICFTDTPALNPPADTVEYIFPAVPSVYNPIVAIHHHEYLFQFELQDGQKS